MSSLRMAVWASLNWGGGGGREITYFCQTFFFSLSFAYYWSGVDIKKLAGLLQDA